MNGGFDFGYYDTKAMGNGGDRITKFPSFVVPAPPDSMLTLGNHETQIITDDGKYLVGTSAVRRGQIGTRKEGSTWIESPEYLVLFYSAMSDISDATQVTLNLVTGLPVGDFRRDAETLQKQLLGTHTFLREGREYHQVVKVQTVTVVPQAWGAVLCLLLDNIGRIVRPELANQKLAVLDIGGKTVNYLSVDGLTDIPAETRGTERGAWNVMRVVRQFLEAEHPGLNRLQDHQIMDAIVKRETWDAGQRVNLEHVVEPILDSIGTEILDTARQHWGTTAATFRQILVCGGGAYLWQQQIQKAFPHSTVIAQPEFANARGFYRYAVHLAGQW